MSNKSLNRALYYMPHPDDEYYTRLEDIEKELSRYESFFKGKKVLCPFDDPLFSAFSVYFNDNFVRLGLKKLVCIGYNRDGLCNIEVRFGENQRLEDCLLLGDWDGDYRSEKLTPFLDDCDVVVSNPPFSELRPFLDVCYDRKKPFFLIGNSNVLHTVKAFGRVKDGLLQAGYTQPKIFDTPDGPKKLGFCCWLTNTGLGVGKGELPLPKKLGDVEWHWASNRKGTIRIARLKDVPCDCELDMAVPFTVLMGPHEQFELIGILRPVCNGKEHFSQIVVRLKPEYLEKNRTEKNHAE